MTALALAKMISTSILMTPRQGQGQGQTAAATPGPSCSSVAGTTTRHLELEDIRLSKSTDLLARWQHLLLVGHSHPEVCRRGTDLRIRRCETHAAPLPAAELQALADSVVHDDGLLLLLQPSRL